jgi:acyl carrier protein
MTKQAFRSVLEDILSIAPGSLRDSDSRETVEAWTSLADVQIMVAMGSELGIEEDPDMLSYESVGDLLAALDARDAFGKA